MEDKKKATVKLEELIIEITRISAEFYGVVHTNRQAEQELKTVDACLRRVDDVEEIKEVVQHNWKRKRDERERAEAFYELTRAVRDQAMILTAKRQRKTIPCIKPS